MQKKVYRLVGFVLILISCFIPLRTLQIEAAVNHFKDVSPDAWYAEAVEQASAKGLMNGLSADIFQPEGTLNRAMFVTILGRMENVDVTLYSGSIYPDVIVGEYYSPYVSWATQNNIINGYENGMFGTYDYVTREQMATIISRYFEYKNLTLPNSPQQSKSFIDSGIVSLWARKGLELMRRTGIIRGHADGYFRPHDAATRAEAAVIFTRLSDAILNNKNKDLFAASDSYQLYKGVLYTTYNMDASSDMRVVTGNYTSTMAIYNDHIYYTDPGGTGEWITNLYRSNLDGSDTVIIATDVDPWSEFCIYDNRLYYTATDEYTMDSRGRSKDLDTLQTYEEPYKFIKGNEYVWIIEPNVQLSYDYYDRMEYCCYPGFIEVKHMPENYNWIDARILGLNEDKMYYFQKYAIMESSVYAPDIRELSVGAYVDAYFDNNTDSAPIATEEALYYTRNGQNHILYRYDFKTKKETSLSNIMNYMDFMSTMGYWHEFNGKLYFNAYVETANTNIVCYEYDLTTQNIRIIGRWMQS